ncbi:MAG TPA: hypothetical protein VGJ60_25955, partial [Chloroflexota bacterium]|jgi:hypothetical protein
LNAATNSGARAEEVTSLAIASPERVRRRPARQTPAQLDAIPFAPAASRGQPAASTDALFFRTLSGRVFATRQRRA